VSVVLAVVVIVVATTLGVTAILLVRRRAPEGSYFQDGDRAAGVFGVLATGFAVLLGFVVFLAYERYDDARSGSEAEALVVVQQFETAQFLPVDVRARLGGELTCYARSVVGQEWPRMENGDVAETLSTWAVALFRTLETVDPKSAPEQAAYSKWLDQTSEREEARRDRLHGAAGVIPGSLWLVLFFSATVIFLFMLFFADSNEGPFTQGMLIGSVVAVMSAMLLLLGFLDNPYRSGPGSLEPLAMERSLRTLDQARRVVGDSTSLPCDEQGRPT
jgi:hypothetical protein